MVIKPDQFRDAVIVLPGIMGSELVEASTGEVLWGLADPTWYVRAWVTGSSLNKLAVTDDERLGRVGRVRATRTLRFPAFVPLLQGMEPYTRLLAEAKRFVPHPNAVLEFAYDWRLAISHNAELLAKAAERHLADWRRHASGSEDAKLVVLAHSMGGLVARYFSQALGGAADIRAMVTLGTPFHGAVKSAAMLSTGRGAPLPLPRQRLRRLARTLPGLHDLLPSYRCVDLGTSARRLSAGDVALLGGDKELAQQAFDRRALVLKDGFAKLHAVVGVQQPTMQSLRIADGIAEPLYHTCEDGPSGEIQRVDRRGDSTVYRDAASLPGAHLAHLPQSHSGLAKSEEALAHACAVMTSRDLGPPLGDGGVGLMVPDCVSAGDAFEILVQDVDDPAAVTCQIYRIEQEGKRFVDQPFLRRRNHAHASSGIALRVDASLPGAGLYRVSVKAGSATAVSQMILAIDPGDAHSLPEPERNH